MKSILTAAFAAGALAVTATQPAAAQATSTINIAGIPFYCNSNMGTLVPIYHTETAQQGGGAMAGFNNYRGFFIDVSPSYMSSINAYAAAFVFLHECAHVALPFGIGMGTFYQESKADCWAIQRMRDFGMIQTSTSSRPPSLRWRTAQGARWAICPAPNASRMLGSACISRDPNG